MRGEAGRTREEHFCGCLRRSRVRARAIGPGVKAADVDRAARQKMQQYGFAEPLNTRPATASGLKRSDAEARPRLHPASPDVLEPGMIFNVEPAAYFEGYGGVRHCDVVAITEDGYEVLTPFLCSKEDAWKGASVMPQLKSQKPAFGAPGADPRWNHANKDGVGTAYDLESRIWFSIWNGIMTEIHYPTIDRPQMRDAQFLLVDPAGVFLDEIRDLTHETGENHPFAGLSNHFSPQ